MRSLTSVKVTPGYSVTWAKRDNYFTGGRIPNTNQSTGYLTTKAISRLRQRVNFMVYIAKDKKLRKSINLPVINYKLTFITLTLSATQLHSDITIKRFMLQPFLRLLRNKWKVTNYIWKSEVQDNGNIHFHITTDRYIHWEEIRNTWNTIQETVTDTNGKGYISRSVTPNPNSTDIHAVYKKSNPAAYLCGYVTKKDIYKKDLTTKTDPNHYYSNLNNITACDLKSKEVVGIKRGIEGKLYDCNKELKNIRVIHDMQFAISSDLESEHCTQSQSNFFNLYFHEHPSEQLPALKMLLDHFIKLAYN